MRIMFVLAVASTVVCLEACSFARTFPDRVALLEPGMKPAAVKEVLGTVPHRPTTAVVNGTTYMQEWYNVQYSVRRSTETSILRTSDVSGKYSTNITPYIAVAQREQKPHDYSAPGTGSSYAAVDIPGIDEYDMRAIVMVYANDSLVYWGDHRGMADDANPDIQSMSPGVDSAYKAYHGE